MPALTGKTVVVTGASRGIGLEVKTFLKFMVI
jgi:NAD(P)-dependent dehydrogenase (short-subunit alcohol dehydrogenase family)